MPPGTSRRPRAVCLLDEAERLHLFNLGWDADLTPKIKLINNYNLLWFDKTAVLEQFVFQGNIGRFVSAILSFTGPCS